MSIWVTLALAILGWIMWMYFTNAVIKAGLAKLGEVLLWTGLLATLLALTGKVIHC